MKAQLLLIGAFVIGLVLLHAWRHSPTIFGRSRPRVLRALSHLPEMLYFYARAFFVIRRPFQFLYCHFRRAVVPCREVQFRSGIRMSVSNAPDDPATLFCIFVKKDYGEIRPNSVVLDVGANIGAYSVYALQCGARIVCAFEPSEESFALLQQNLHNNGFSSRASCHLQAVSNRSHQKLLFPKSSDPSNSPVAQGDPLDCAWVTTISLSDILTQAGIDHVDYLKLDCEGSEYPIILESDPEVWTAIQDVRVEYHGGHEDKLIDRLQQLGFTLNHRSSTSQRVGHLWFNKRGAAAPQGHAALSPPSVRSASA